MAFIFCQFAKKNILVTFWKLFFWRKSFNPIIVTSKIILFETVPNKLVGFVGEGGVFRIIKLAGDGVLGGDSPS